MPDLRGDRAALPGRLNPVGSLRLEVEGFSEKLAQVLWHREEGRLAAMLGDIAGAIRAYGRYLALRSDAESRLQPKV